LIERYGFDPRVDVNGFPIDPLHPVNTNTRATAPAPDPAPIDIADLIGRSSWPRRTSRLSSSGQILRPQPDALGTHRRHDGGKDRARSWRQLGL
jgi:hypothetical protein